jgi:glutaredoxin
VTGRDVRPAVILYTQPGCTDCVLAEAFLNRHRLPYDRRDVTADPEARRVLIEELGSCRTPTFVIGDQVVVGFSRHRQRIEALLALGR